jgi:hypothetical protein
MNLERVAAIANQHDADAASIAQYGCGFTSRTLSREEHAEIAEICRMYQSAVQRENMLLDKFAGHAMQGLLAGMSANPANLLDGAEIAATAYDIAGLMMALRASERGPL